MTDGEGQNPQGEAAPHIEYPPELPVSARRDEILSALDGSQVVIVCGDTGSGKTTQLPKMALESFLARGMRRCRVACTQPRRLAAVTMAERVAHEMKCAVGSLVGYQHRFGRSLSRDTRIKFMTDGVLLAETRSDPLLRAYDAIIVDEAHERSLNVDFLLGIISRILPRRRNLKVVVSSATLDAERFSEFFGGAPVVSVPGRLFPIEMRYRPPHEDDEQDLARDVAAAMAELPPEGDVLVFLPGERDIRDTAAVLERARPGDEIIPLLASLPAAEQRRAFRTSQKRRIILATNVAETSVTIPGIRCVIDSGLARISRYVHRTQVQRLQIEPVSQASARQRAGRCGRLGPGTCIRLYSEDDFNSRDAYTPPEVLRSSLAGVILSMLDLNLGDVERFPFIDPPRPAMVREGLRELLELGAIAHDRARRTADGTGETRIVLTPVGRSLARIPVEPRLARMLLAASENATLGDAVPVVAAMACDDPRRRPVEEREKAVQAHAQFRAPGSDFLGTLRLWRWWDGQCASLSQSKLRALAKKTYLSYPKMREWRDLARQLTDLSKKLGLSFAAGGKRKAEESAALLHQALLTGLLGRIGKFDEEEREYRGAHGLRFAVHPASALKKATPPWIMAGELVDTARLFARDAAAIEPEWIERAAGPLCRHSCHSPEWDARSGFVRATEQVTLYGLVIVPARRCDFSRFNRPLAREIFILHGLVNGEFQNPPPEVRSNNALLDALRRRAEKARRPELFDAERLTAHFDAVIPPDVASAPALRKWLCSPDGKSQRERFLLKKDEWWPADDIPDADFPDSIRINGVKMSLSYRNAPDDEDGDGITCTALRSQAPLLRIWRADWLVPGALPEKLAFLVSALPSSLRRLLTPIDDTVSGLLAHLKPGSEPLVDAVRRTVQEQWGFRIPSDAWDGVRLPPHLRVRFRIRDDATGRVVACSRDLEQALAQAGVKPAAALASTVPAGRRSTSWTFGDIPEVARDAEAGWTLEHFPALHDEGDGVSLRLHADAKSAAAAHAAGVTRLFLIALGGRVGAPFRARSLPIDAQMYLKSLDYGDDRIASDLLAGAVREALVRGQPPVRDAETFRRRLEEGRAAVAAAQAEMARILSASYSAAAKIDESLERERLPEETADSIRTQLAWLLYPGFPRSVPLGRLRRYERYLKGAAVRVERARTNPSGDLSKEERFAPYWLLYRDAATGKSKVKFDQTILADVRWMLEEYRVSLFAQELRTPEPVSPKRIDARLADAVID